MKIDLENIHFAYHVNSHNPVFTGLTCTINQGELIGVIGKTGSGKSTFLQLCAGFLTPISGEIRVNGSPAKNGREWNKFRRNIGLVFQFPEKQLFEESVFADVAFGISKITNDTGDIKTRVYKALEEVNLPPEEFADRSPHHLSSGEQRKAALAGIIVLEPDMLFLDEPTIGLDWKGIAEVESIIIRLYRQGKTVCVVSHNLDFIVRVTKRILVIADKTIKYDGLKNRLFFDNELLHSLRLEKPEIIALSETIGKQQKRIIRDVYDIDELIKLLKHPKNSQESNVKTKTG